MEKPKLKDQLKKYQDSANKKLDQYVQDKENWRYLEVIITLASVTFFIVFAIRPTVVTITGLIGEINEKRELTQKMQQKIDTIIIAQEEFALVQGNRDLLESYLPTRYSISQGIAQVAGISMDNGLPLKHVGMDSIENMVNPTKDFASLEFDFSTGGSYQQLRSFLMDIDAVRRWIDVNRFEISVNDDKDTPPGFLKFNFQGGLNYWFDEVYEQKKNN